MMLCSGKGAQEVKDVCNLRPPVLCGLRPALARIRHATDNAGRYLTFAQLRRNPWALDPGSTFSLADKISPRGSRPSQIRRTFRSMGSKPTLGRHERAALNAVARHFSATWDLGETPPAAYLQISGKRIALGIATMKVRTETSTKPRLRFDKVALGLVRALQADPGNVVPADQMVIVTVTAPIRSDSKTTAALRETIRECLTRRARRVEVRQTIHENRTAVRRMKGMPRTTSKVIGFVHNPGPDPGVLLDLTESLAKCIAGAANEAMTAKSNGDRWLVIAIESGLPHIETYRHAYSQLGIESNFKRIIMVLAGERVEILKG